MDILKNSKRIVFKIGTSSLTHDTGRLNLHRIETLVRVLSDFRNSGKDVILVTSGAISAGVSRLGLHHRPHTIEEKQAMAAVGQCEIMRMYERFFDMYGHPVGQILVTREVIDIPEMRHNSVNTFNTLLKMNCIPIVNENDTVSFEEIQFGGNDTLAAYVAIICEADALVILSDIDGLYDSDPRHNPDAKLIHTVPVVDEKIMSYGGGAGTERGTGGFETKLKAAKIVTENGIPMFILNGEDPNILYDLFDGNEVGTYFMTNGSKIKSE